MVHLADLNIIINANISNINTVIIWPGLMPIQYAINTLIFYSANSMSHSSHVSVIFHDVRNKMK